MGMGEMFTPKANLSGFLETGDPLQVSDIIHKAFLEVTEGGCEAASSTSKYFYTNSN